MSFGFCICLGVSDRDVLVEFFFLFIVWVGKGFVFCLLVFGLREFFGRKLSIRL